MNKIRENLWLGNSNSANDPALLKQYGITAILNVAYEISDREYAPEIFRYVKIGLGDYSLNKLYMKDLAIIVLERMLDEGEIVFVHCAAGASRSPYIIARYLSKKEDKHINDVMVELQKLRFGVVERSPLQDE